MDENDRALTAFTMLGHGTVHSYELAIPVFAVIWLDVFGTTTAVLGVVVGASYALVGFGAIPGGILADRFGAKPVVLACLAGMAVSFVLVSLAPNLVVLAVALVLWGGAASLYHPAGLALISRGAKARGTAFAYHGVAGNLGIAAGPLLAALLLLVAPWRVVAAALVGPTLLAALVGLFLEFDETAGSAAREHGESSGRDDHQDSLASDGGQSGERRVLGQPHTVPEFLSDSRRLFTGGFVLVFAVGLLFGIYYRGLFTFLPDILADLPTFAPLDWRGYAIEPGQYVYSGLLLVGAVGQYAGGRLVDRIPVEYALVAAYLALVPSALLFVPARTAGLAPLLLVAGLLGFVVFGTAPINQEAIATYSAPSMRGLSFGYTYTAIFGFGAVGAMLAGVVLSWWSPAVLFAVLGTLAVLATVLAAVLLARGRAQDESR
jgi:MFS family permease